MQSSAKPADWKTLLAQLWRIRLFEGHVQRLAAGGEVPGFPHLSTGQEAVAVGVCAHLTQNDVVFTGHRGHGHSLAKGCNLTATMAEILGRDTGLCRGRGGSMHLVDAGCGMLGATGVVAGNLPLAAGAAWAAQARQTGAISVVFFGDGATGAGVFHETLNLAGLWKLPLLLVCENNGYAEFTSRAEHSDVAKVSAFAAPYSIPSATIDGNDLIAVHQSAASAIEHVRRGDGPYLLECMTVRLAGHYVGDQQQYRSKEELAEALKKCPIERLKSYLLSQGVTDDELMAIADQIKQEVQRDVDAARAAAAPDPASFAEGVYASPLLAAGC